MNDIKNILIFLSLSLKVFLGFVLFNLLYLLICIIAILVIFIASPALLIHPLFLLLLLTGVILCHFILKKGFLFKYQWMLNFKFTDFLTGESSPDNTVSTEYDSVLKLPVKKIKKQFQAVKSDLKSRRLLLISNPVILLMAITQMSIKHTWDKEADIAEPIRRLGWRYLVLNLLAFLMLLIPFVLISILLTIGIQWQFKYLIFFLGFIFAYFLYSALFVPIVSLLIQRQIHISFLERP